MNKISCYGFNYSRSTLEHMTKKELIELLETAQDNYSALYERFERVSNILIKNKEKLKDD